MLADFSGAVDYDQPLLCVAFDASLAADSALKAVKQAESEVAQVSAAPHARGVAPPLPSGRRGRSRHEAPCRWVAHLRLEGRLLAQDLARLDLHALEALLQGHLF